MRGDRPVAAHRRQERVPTRGDASVGGTQAEDVVEGGRVAQRAHEVAPVRDGEHAERHRHGGPAAAAAGRPGLVVSVERGAVDRVEGVRPQRELRHVGPADDDRAGGPHPLDDDGIDGGDEVLEGWGAVRADDAADRLEVLDGLRHAVQPSPPFAAGDLRVTLRRLPQQPVPGLSRDDRVHVRVHRVDVIEKGRHDLDTGHAPGPNGVGEGDTLEHDDVRGPRVDPTRHVVVPLVPGATLRGRAPRSSSAGRLGPGPHDHLRASRWA